MTTKGKKRFVTFEIDMEKVKQQLIRKKANIRAIKDGTGCAEALDAIDDIYNLFPAIKEYLQDSEDN